MNDTRTTPAKTAPKTVRARASAQIDAARDAASDAALRTVEAIESNPMSVLIGGLAVGVVAGALIPRGEREKAALAPIGKRIAEGATAAFAAAKATGKEQISASVMSKEAAKEGARRVFDSAVSAAKATAAKPTPVKASGTSAPAAPKNTKPA